MGAIEQGIIDRFIGLVGARYGLTSAEDVAPFLVEWRDKYQGVSPLVLLPGSVEEVASIVKLAAETRTAIVPQGGNTGLVGGQLPDQSGLQIVVSLKRLNECRSISSISQSMVVEAGVTLQQAQEFALEHERLFPLSLASEGSCQIGGNISSNAGGIQVLKYGMMRDLVLGLEVVLPSGEIWRGLTNLRKDNTGYDLKQLFIGAEGTLGIITAATLRLFPLPIERQVGFVGCSSLEDLSRFFEHCSERAGAALGAFEIISGVGLEFVLKHGGGNKVDGKTKPPLERSWPWYGLIEIESAQEGVAQPLIEGVLEGAFADKLIGDAVVSSSEAQRLELWALREGMSAAQKPEGGSIKHDVSVPVASIPTFITQANQLVERLIPGARPVPFGHFGDGNIHYNISQPLNMDKQVFLDKWEMLSGEIYNLVAEFNGSISAEHGIGVMKRELMAGIKSDVELEMMRAVKRVFDPLGIMNPGKVI